jgi:hypothetical protein
LLSNLNVVVTMTRMTVGRVVANIAKLPPGLIEQLRAQMTRTSMLVFSIHLDIVCQIIRENRRRLGPCSRCVGYPTQELNDCLISRPFTRVAFEDSQSPVITTLVAACEADHGTLAALVSAHMTHQPTAELLEECALHLWSAMSNGHSDQCISVLQGAICRPVPWRSAVDCVYAVYMVAFTLPGRIAVQFPAHAALKRAASVPCSPRLQAQLPFLAH